MQAGPETLSFLLKVYSESAMAAIKKDELDEKNRTEWIHLSHLLDILALDKLMTQDFDFKHYYCEYGKYEMKELAEKVRGRLNLL